MSFRLNTLLLACGLTLTSALANAAPLEEVLELASASRLHEHPYWRILLRYEGRQQASLVRQAAFFVHPEGARNAEAEIRADIHSLYTDSAELGDQAFGCRFPARAAWLRASLPIEAKDLSPVSCQALTTWMQGINPQQATLIFASDYLNNPSSMFGHTLLRIDAPDQTEETRLLAYAVNYTAQTQASNSIDFAWKGLTGGYPGAFSVLPYYQKVKEYNDFENRDLWEYQLNLTPAEVTRLLQHLWELKGVQFPYFFLSSNCSYQLLGLFEAARPGLAMRRDFPVHAIPSDTLRRVLAEQGMLKAVVYRPASGTLLDAHARQNPTAINRAAMQLAEDPEAPLADLDSASQARAIEMGYDWLYYRYLDHKADPATTPAKLRRLLIRRSTYAEADNRRAPPQPATDPAQSHRTMMWQTGGGHEQDQGYLALDFRPAYHDLLDDEAGYRQGAAIDFLHGQVRYRPEDRQLELQQFTLVHIDSLAPRNDFLKPTSWNLGVGARRIAVDRQGRFSRRESHLAGYLEGGVGVTAQPDAGMLCHAVLQQSLQGGKALEDGWRFGIGPRAGCRYQGRRGQWLGQVEALWFNDSAQVETSVEAGYQWNLDKDNGLRVEARYQAADGSDWHGLSLGWRHYY